MSKKMYSSTFDYMQLKTRVYTSSRNSRDRWGEVVRSIGRKLEGPRFKPSMDHSDFWTVGKKSFFFPFLQNNILLLLFLIRIIVIIITIITMI